MRGYASVLAMHAFGLQENGDYHHAELVARAALALNNGHPGAIHAIVHVMEMQGRAAEGLAFLADTEEAWMGGTALSVHLAWHRALFQLDQEQPAAALATYDAKIGPALIDNGSALIDGSALLWRLQLANVDVRARWRALADRWADQPLHLMRPFHAVHAMMAFASARRRRPAARVLALLRRGGLSESSPALPEDALAEPLCAALLGFVRGDYAECIGLLSSVRDIQQGCGGSLAQCDLIHLTFTEAALRASQLRLARALVAERATRKRTSLLNGLLQQRLAGLRVGAMPPAAFPRGA